MHGLSNKKRFDYTVHIHWQVLHNTPWRSSCMGATNDSSSHHKYFLAAWYYGCQCSSLKQIFRLVATYSLLWKEMDDPPWAPTMLAPEQLAIALANTAWRFKCQDEARGPRGRAGAAHLYCHYCRTGQGGMFLPWGCIAAFWKRIGLALLGFKMSCYFAKLTERNFTCENFDDSCSCSSITIITAHVLSLHMCLSPVLLPDSKCYKTEEVRYLS